MFNTSKQFFCVKAAWPARLTLPVSYWMSQRTQTSKINLLTLATVQFGCCSVRRKFGLCEFHMPNCKIQVPEKHPGKFTFKINPPTYTNWTSRTSRQNRYRGAIRIYAPITFWPGQCNSIKYIIHLFEQKHMESSLIGNCSHLLSSY